MNIRMSSTFISTSVALAVSSALLCRLRRRSYETRRVCGSAENKLTQLQSDSTLANRASVAMKDADAAVRAAEVPQRDEALARHLVLIADRKVDSAQALAKTSLAEDQRKTLSEEREKARLDARTHEADVAKSQVAAALADGAEQKRAAERSQLDADTARVAAANSQLQTAELQRQATDMQRQIDEMNAKVTDRGVVLTLGDVLFSTGRAELKDTATGNLNKLVTFLGNYPQSHCARRGLHRQCGKR